MDESIVKEFEQQQVGKLKLSQAIRIGAKIRPQSHIGMFHNGETCAQGAAAEGCGYDFSNGDTDAMDFLRARFPNPTVILPGGSTQPLLGHFGAIAVLNDNMYGNLWSRERIANWLESQGL